MCIILFTLFNLYFTRKTHWDQNLSCKRGQSKVAVAQNHNILKWKIQNIIYKNLQQNKGMTIPLRQKLGKKIMDLRVESQTNLKRNVDLLHLLFDKSNWERKSAEIWEAWMHLQAPKRAEKSLAAECNALTFINVIIDLLLSNAQNPY